MTSSHLWVLLDLSGRRDLNPRLPGPEPGALPLRYCPLKGNACGASRCECLLVRFTSWRLGTSTPFSLIPSSRWARLFSQRKNCPTALLSGATGLEPAISGLTGRRDNQLRYAPICCYRIQSNKKKVKQHLIFFIRQYSHKKVTLKLPCLQVDFNLLYNIS